MASIKERIASLQASIKTMSVCDTVFIIDGGAEFRTKDDPLEYLLKNGAYMPDGRRIVSYPHPRQGIDALSLSLYELIDEAVAAGEFSLTEPQSDEVL